LIRVNADRFYGGYIYGNAVVDHQSEQVRLKQSPSVNCALP